MCSEEKEKEEVDPQDVFDDWVMGLQKGDEKMLAVCLFTTFQKRQKMSIMDAAQEAASITGFNEKTVHACAKEAMRARQMLVALQMRREN